MIDINHRVGIESSSSDATYTALSTTEGLSSWWTTDTTGDTSLGGTIEFRFGEGGFDMEVTQAVDGEHIQWTVTAGPPEWVGTTIDWRVSWDDGFTIVMFTHAGWAETSKFMSHCSTKWATFLLSLKSLIETGSGSPAPNDVRIDNWG